MAAGPARDDKDARKANKRGAARLAAVQALYQMDLAGTGLNEILAEFESHWIGREVEGAQYLPAEAAFFRDIVSGVVHEQRELDPLIDEALSKGWPLKRIETVLRAALRAGAYELIHRDRRARAGRGGRICRRRGRLCRARRDRHGQRRARPARAALCVQTNSAAPPGDTMAPHDDMSPEDRLIARFFKPLATHPGALGLSDDAAFLTPPAGFDLVLTTDAIVGGVHFFPEDAADTVAGRALRVNLSDLAAKGARPLGFLLSLALPREIGEQWLEGFAQGLRADADLFGCPLFGGDTDRTPGPIVVSIAMFGTVPEGTMVRRAGAKAGDRVFVTGTIGDAALGVMMRNGKRWKLDEPQRQHLLSRYLVPQPRNALAEAVRIHASAAMDISDGLAGDFGKLCRVSGVAADVDVARVPLSEAARAVIAANSGRGRIRAYGWRRLRDHLHCAAGQSRKLPSRRRGCQRRGQRDRRDQGR